jgi:alginate O-acetyltransferase complex protein AlgI
MLFNSFSFLIFFIGVTSLYFTLPHKFRWMLLLVASCVFYMFFIPAYLLILLFTICIDYAAGILIEESSSNRRKKFLWMSIVANVAVLSVFKYYNFLNDNITALLHLTAVKNPIPYLDIILPIGLSFHTFQAMSYTIEVYRGHQKAERNAGIFALYVMFYPQLVAGPIERPQNLLHQFREKHTIEYQRIVDGLKLMVWGLFKKVVIADRLAPLVDLVYSDPGNHYGWSVVIATTLFAFQIYCDFSGYSDMAIGAARVMGFKLMTNFRTPYFATSISKFWKRWHISLSTWFKDYLYIPLGGNKVGKSRWYFNLFITFLISGIWHGANWTFIAWGALHGFYLVFAIVTQHQRKLVNEFLGLHKFKSGFNALQSFIVFVLVAFAWIFFRAASINDAFMLIKNMTLSDPSELKIFATYEFITAIFLTAILLFAEKLLGNHSLTDVINKQTKALRWSLYVLVCFMILNFGVFGGSNFIYFQF